MSMTPDMMTAEQWREVAEMLERGQSEAVDELATLRTRLAEVEAENERLRAIAERSEKAVRVLGNILATEGLKTGNRVACELLNELRAALAQTTESSHDDDT